MLNFKSRKTLSRFQIFRFFVEISILIFLNTVGTAKFEEVSCESVKERDWGRYVTSGTEKTCRMDKTTSITTPNVTISTRDKYMCGLWLNENKKIEYLPTGVDEKFPDLRAYSASGCSIKEISRDIEPQSN